MLPTPPKQPSNASLLIFHAYLIGTAITAGLAFTWLASFLLFLLGLTVVILADIF